MNDLIKFQAIQILTLQSRVSYLENELNQAKQLFQDIVNDWEVHQEEEVKYNPSTTQTTRLCVTLTKD